MDKGKVLNSGANKGNKTSGRGTVNAKTHRLQPDSLPDARVGGIENPTGPPGRMNALLAHWMVRKLCNTARNPLVKPEQ